MIIEHQREIDKAMAWSKLSANPVCIYLEKYDDTLVVWNGVLMTKLLALNLAIEIYGKYPSPTVKAGIFKSYEQLYITGFFGKQNWDSFFENPADGFFGYMRTLNNAHLQKVTKGKKISEVLLWFVH